MRNVCARPDSAVTAPELSGVHEAFPAWATARVAADEGTVRLTRWQGTAPAICEPSRPQVRSLAARVLTAMARLFVGVPAKFEIRNVQTGELARCSPFSDGTEADRAARELGPNWRVFRQQRATF